jgi:hypothetical protein
VSRDSFRSLPTEGLFCLWSNSYTDLIVKCMYVQSFFFFVLYYWNCGLGSSVGIATGYGLDGTAIESQWRWDFPHLSWPALGFTQPPVQWVSGLFWGKERPGDDTAPSPTSSAVGHERLELHLYSPYRPYGLYSALVPVQRCTLPFVLYYWNCLRNATWYRPFDRYVNSNLLTTIRLLNTRYIPDCFTWDTVHRSLECESTVFLKL